MHILEKFEGDEVARGADRILTPVDPAVLSRTLRLEVWGSSFKDPGPDFCEARFFDATGALIAARRMEGY